VYDVIPKEEAGPRPAHALMLRSHKLKEEEMDPSVRCIARCGAGTNNIPVARMTELGIPVSRLSTLSVMVEQDMNVL
jgi:D-3-phosphoglycerate dehydrogenase